MLTTSQNPANGNVTLHFDDGVCVTVDRRTFAELGLKGVVQYYRPDYEMPTQRVDVIQSGHKVGTLPADFSPMAIKSRNVLYAPRPGDFVLSDGKWIADRMLGPGDLDAVEGFTRAKYEGETK